MDETGIPACGRQACPGLSPETYFLSNHIPERSKTDIEKEVVRGVINTVALFGQ
jgi:hypothetical protein